VPADLVAVSDLPQGSLFAPHTPAGVVIIGKDIWVGDGAEGLRHYVPVDPANADPINTGQLMFDINTEWSIPKASPDSSAAAACGRLTSRATSNGFGVSTVSHLGQRGTPIKTGATQVPENPCTPRSAGKELNRNTLSATIVRGVGARRNR
jgi:hypothetical protein